MDSKYLLGVDIGTYSSKGVLVDLHGEIIASYTVPHSMEMPEPGFFEHDSEEVWWGDFVAIVKELLRQSGVDPKLIASIGASAIGSCVLPVDKEGKPLRKGILYGIDTRANNEIGALERNIGRDNIYAKCGSHLSSQASGPKILWIRNNEFEVFKNTRWFLTSQAFVVLKLTGVASIDIYTAAGYAPLFDIHNYCWIDEHAEFITSSEKLPKALWSCEVVGNVTPEAAEETGLNEGTPVITGTTDAAAEAIGAGVAGFGEMMLMFGSSTFFIMKTEDLMQTDQFWSSPFLEADSYAFTGGMSTSGSLTTWFRDNFSHFEMKPEESDGESRYSSLARMAAESPAGSNGLVVLPYFEGERTPIHDHKAKGVVFGLGLKHTPGDLYRAILEGVGYGIRHNLDIMKENNVVPESIIAVGGGTKNREWLQLVADIADIRMTVPSQQIGACYGDAFMAGVGVGLFNNLSEIRHWLTEKIFILPDKENHDTYDFNYRLYRKLYTTNKDLMHELYDFQNRIRN